MGSLNASENESMIRYEKTKREHVLGTSGPSSDEPNCCCRGMKSYAYSAVYRKEKKKKKEKEKEKEKKPHPRYSSCFADKAKIKLVWAYAPTSNCKCHHRALTLNL